MSSRLVSRREIGNALANSFPIAAIRRWGCARPTTPRVRPRSSNRIQMIGNCTCSRCSSTEKMIPATVGPIVWGGGVPIATSRGRRVGRRGGIVPAGEEGCTTRCRPRSHTNRTHSVPVYKHTSHASTNHPRPTAAHSLGQSVLT